MYTLRTWRSNSEETNQWIGDNFRIVMRENNEENFIAEWNFHTKTKNEQMLNPEVIGMIYSEQVEMPLESNTHYYIMTESGKTFKHIHVTQTKEEWNSSAALNDFTGEHCDIGGELRSITGKGKVSSAIFLPTNVNTNTATRLPQDATLTKKMSNNKQSSVEWLVHHFIDYGFDLSLHQFEIEQAKAMHKEECKESYYESLLSNFQTFEQYYNETFGGNNEQQ